MDQAMAPEAHHSEHLFTLKSFLSHLPSFSVTKESLVSKSASSLVFQMSSLSLITSIATPSCNPDADIYRLTL